MADHATTIEEMDTSARVVRREPETQFSLLPSILLDKVFALASYHGLSANELDLLVSVVSGLSRKEYVRLRNMSENTCKKRAQSAVRKLGVLSLGEVRDELLKDTVGRYIADSP